LRRNAATDTYADRCATSRHVARPSSPPITPRTAGERRAQAAADHAIRAAAHHAAQLDHSPPP
jgi:hypothetical protein